MDAKNNSEWGVPLLEYHGPGPPQQDHFSDLHANINNTEKIPSTENTSTITPRKLTDNLHNNRISQTDALSSPISQTTNNVSMGNKNIQKSTLLDGVSPDLTEILLLDDNDKINGTQNIFSQSSTSTDNMNEDSQQSYHPLQSQTGQNSNIDKQERRDQNDDVFKMLTQPNAASRSDCIIRTVLLRKWWDKNPFLLSILFVCICIGAIVNLYPQFIQNHHPKKTGEELLHHRLLNDEFVDADLSSYMPNFQNPLDIYDDDDDDDNDNNEPTAGRAIWESFQQGGDPEFYKQQDFLNNKTSVISFPKLLDELEVPSGLCPLVELDGWSNTYRFRFNYTLSVELYWAHDDKCLITNMTTYFRVQAVHFHLGWIGVVPLIESKQYTTVCTGKEQCVFRVNPPPHPTLWLENLGFWIPRNRAHTVSVLLIIVAAIVFKLTGISVLIWVFIPFVQEVWKNRPVVVEQFLNPILDVATSMKGHSPRKKKKKSKLANLRFYSVDQNMHNLNLTPPTPTFTQSRSSVHTMDAISSPVNSRQHSTTPDGKSTGLQNRNDFRFLLQQPQLSFTKPPLLQSSSAGSLPTSTSLKKVDSNKNILHTPLATNKIGLRDDSRLSSHSGKNNFFSQFKFVFGFGGDNDRDSMSVDMKKGLRANSTQSFGQRVESTDSVQTFFFRPPLSGDKSNENQLDNGKETYQYSSPVPPKEESNNRLSLPSLYQFNSPYTLSVPKQNSSLANAPYRSSQVTFLDTPDGEIEFDDNTSTTPLIEAEEEICEDEQENDCESEDSNDTSSCPIKLPDHQQMIEYAIDRLGNMFFALLSLLFLCFYFVMRREVTTFRRNVIIAFPVVLILVHSYILLKALFHMMLYFAVLEHRRHLTFPPKTMWRTCLQTHWLIAIIVSSCWFVVVIESVYVDILHDFKWHDSAKRWVTMILSIALKVYGMFFPAIFCLTQLYSDNHIEKRLATLHGLYCLAPARPHGMHVRRGRELEAQMFRIALAEMPDIPVETLFDTGDFIYQETMGMYFDVETLIQYAGRIQCPEKTQMQKKLVDFSISRQIWTWRIRLASERDPIRSIRRVAIIIIASGTLAVLFVCTSLLYIQLLIPTLNHVTMTDGQLFPPFRPSIHDYNIYVNKYTRSGTLAVKSNSDLVNQAEVVFPNSEYSESWKGKHHAIHINFHKRSFQESINKKNYQQKQSEEEPEFFTINAYGAGVTMTYRFTVIKTDMAMVSMDYTYQLKNGVDPVHVQQQLDVDSLHSHSLEYEAATQSSRDSDNQLVSYIPESTNKLTLAVAKHIIIYGPTDTDPTDFKATTFRVNTSAKVRICKKFFWCPKRMDERRVFLGTKMKTVSLGLRGNKVGLPNFFPVSIVPVKNRLVMVDVEVFMDFQWKKIPLIPTFFPFNSFYDVFFDLNPNPITQEETLFFRVRPAGSPLTNYVRIDIDMDNKRGAPASDNPLVDDGADSQVFCQKRYFGLELLEKSFDPSTGEIKLDISDKGGRDVLIEEEQKPNQKKIDFNFLKKEEEDLEIEENAQDKSKQDDNWQKYIQGSIDDNWQKYVKGMVSGMPLSKSDDDLDDDVQNDLQSESTISCNLPKDGRDMEQEVKVSNQPSKKLLLLVDGHPDAFQDHFFMRYRYIPGRELEKFTINFQPKLLGGDETTKKSQNRDSDETYRLSILPRKAMEISMTVPAPVESHIGGSFTTIQLTLSPAFDYRRENYQIFVPTNSSRMSASIHIRQDAPTSDQDDVTSSQITQDLKITPCEKEYCHLKLHVYEKREGYPFIFDTLPVEYDGILFLGTAPIQARDSSYIPALTNQIGFAERNLITTFETNVVTILNNINVPLYALSGGDDDVIAQFNGVNLPVLNVRNRWWRIAIESVQRQICWCQREMGLEACNIGTPNDCILDVIQNEKLTLTVHLGSDEFRQLRRSAEDTSARMPRMQQDAQTEQVL